MKTENHQQQTLGKSAAFSGHRHIPPAIIPSLRTTLTATIHQLYDEGYRTFYCGMAMGFDLLAAESVLSLRESLMGIELVAVIPFTGQELYFSPEDKSRYQHLLSKANRQITIASNYSKLAYLRRNDYMLQHSSLLIAYLDSTQSKGGTAYTFRKAVSFGLPTLNLF